MNYGYPWAAQTNGYPSASIQPNMVQQQGMNDLVFTVSVSNVQQVENYPVAVGGTVFLIDYSNGKLYSKTNPGNGFAPIIKIYSIKEENTNEENAEQIKIDDFKDLKATVMNLKKIVEDLMK